MKKLFISALVLAAFVTTTNGQATATASATAVIVTPISITKASGGDMHFGNIATNGTAGSVIIAPDGGRTFGTQGGLTFPATTGAFRQATFNVAGNALYTYAITLPATFITLTSGANSMTVDTWTSDGTPTQTEGVLDGAGADVLNIGATLNVGASQAAGTYTLTNGISITVNYN